MKLITKAVFISLDLLKDHVSVCFSTQYPRELVIPLLWRTKREAEMLEYALLGGRWE